MSKSYSFTPYTWHCRDRKVELNRCFIMGILNVTPDSFSDGALHYSFEDAISWAHKLLDDGADVIDVGGESTRPGSKEVSIHEEIARVIPVIQELSKIDHILISVDTRHAEVAQAAIDAGAHIINDVSGFRNQDMIRVAKNSDAGLIVMHMKGEPGNMQKDPHYNNVLEEIKEYLLSRAEELEAQGVNRERIMLDPGPGFGKTTVHDLEIQTHFEEFAQMGYPVLEAPSRKRYLGDISGQKPAAQRDIITASQCVIAANKGAHMVRVHNVSTCFDALLALQRPAKKAYIALGANLHNELNMLKEARDRVGKLPLTQLIKSSSAYTSTPAYVQNQNAFVNAVIKIETSLHPLVLLTYLLAIENELGRVRHEANGPRCIDLDLIAYEGEIHAGTRLSLPHPKAFERDFVLTPLEEILGAQDGHLDVGKLLGTHPLKKDARLGKVLNCLGKF